MAEVPIELLADSIFNHVFEREPLSEISINL